MTTIRTHLESIRDQAALLPAPRISTERSMSESIYGQALAALELLDRDAGRVLYRGHFDAAGNCVHSEFYDHKETT